MILFAKLGVGIIGAALVGGAALSSEGFIHVKVHERHPGGTNINLIVPAALVPTTLKFIPNNHLADASENVRPYLPIIDAAVPALNDCPDGVLVEVVDPGEHVLITKSGGSINSDVTQSAQTGQRSFPLLAAQ